MEQNNRPVRRVGTVTMGAVLIISGICMLLGMFFPALDLTLALQLSPLILISLGVETLLSAKKGGRIQYDWVGMLLCTILVCTAASLYSIAWVAVRHPEWIYR